MCVLIYFVFRLTRGIHIETFWASNPSVAGCRLSGASISSPRSLQACKQEGVLPQERSCGAYLGAFFGSKNGEFDQQKVGKLKNV